MLELRKHASRVLDAYHCLKLERKNLCIEITRNGEFSNKTTRTEECGARAFFCFVPRPASQRALLNVEQLCRLRAAPASMKRDLFVFRIDSLSGSSNLLK
jgi:hypothetical protein